jgi:carbonic anhydrase
VIGLPGNFVDDNGRASAEYGVAVLGASLIVVLGHGECGAIKSTIDVITKKKELPGHLPKLVSYFKPPVERALKQGENLLVSKNYVQSSVLADLAVSQTPVEITQRNPV